MKKKLALLLSAVMVVGMIPMTAFAITTNEISRVVTATADTKLEVADAPKLIIRDKSLNGDLEAFAFKATLSGAEWLSGIEAASVVKVTDGSGDNTVAATVTKLSSTQVIVEVAAMTKGDKQGRIEMPLLTELKSEGDVTVTIDPMNSEITGGTIKYANVVSGSTTTTIEKKTDLQESGSDIKSIIITEVAAGSLEDGTIKIKLTNGFEFTQSSFTAKVYPQDQLTSGGTLTFNRQSDDKAVAEAEIELVNADGTTQAVTISINGINVGYDSDDVNAEDVCEATVSGAGISKTTLEVGTAKAYGVSFTAENKTVPTFYAGRADNDKDSLKMTFKEVIQGSWLEGRKTTLTLPEGVKIIADDDDEIPLETKNISDGEVIAVVDQKDDTTVLTLKVVNTDTVDPITPWSRSGKVEVKFDFNLSIDPEFTGDIVATIGGAGVEEDMSVVIGTVVSPITVEAETNEVSIDYRNVAIGDIIIKEADTGLLEKGKTLYLQLEELRFDGTPTVEVVEGDIKIEKVKVTNGKLAITVKTASQKTPAVLKVTDNELYLDRTLPAGSYELSLVQGSSDTYFQNFIADLDAAADDDKFKFETDEVVVLKDFVEVVTAGRDQDDSTFTTQISVTIGADKLVAGKTDIALDVPAYISEGYTMLPVRAVTEALSGKAIVRWDDATKTVTITFGSRVVSMTVGSKTMNINGVAVQMAKACEITDSRAFIPLRDLGYALGLNDSKINWDDATKTATLN